MRRVRILEKIDGLAAMEKTWTDLETSAWLPMQQFIWAEACAQVHTQEGELRILVLEEGEDIVAIAPLVHRKGSSHLEILGVPQLSEPTDVVFARSDVLASLASALVALKMPLLLRRLPGDSPL